jgi:hypothetical protein
MNAGIIPPFLFRWPFGGRTFGMRIMVQDRSAPPQNTAALGAGFGIGLLWWVMAVTCLWSSYRGYANDRYDWGLGWGLVGVLLAAAGTAAMVGTWWHLTRVREH